MGEICICGIEAFVMNYDEASCDWVNLGSRQHPSKIKVFQAKPAGKCRIVSWSMPDRKVIINENVTKGMKYEEASANFHYWLSGSRTWGIQFTSEKDAQSFASTITACLQGIKERVPNSPVQTRRATPPQRLTEKPPQNDQPIPETNRSSTHSTDSSDDAQNSSHSKSQSIPSPPSGGPPPPPPPPPKPAPIVQQPSKPGGSGGLATALQGAKLTQAAPAPKPKPAPLSMMDEMQQKLKKRKEESGQPKTSDGPPEPSRPPKPSSSPLRLDTKKAVAKPSFKSPVTTSPSPKTNDKISSIALKELKAELIEAFRKELLEVKEQIVTEIVEHLQQ